MELLYVTQRNNPWPGLKKCCPIRHRETDRDDRRACVQTRQPQGLAEDEKCAPSRQGVGKDLDELQLLLSLAAQLALETPQRHRAPEQPRHGAR